MSEKSNSNLSRQIHNVSANAAELTPDLSKSPQPTLQLQRCPLYKPIPVVVSSITLGAGSTPPMYTSSNNVPSVARTPSEVVALDHCYSLLPQTAEDALLKPITKPVEIIRQEEHGKSEKAPKIEKPEKTVKPIPIIKKEVERPVENVLVKAAKYIFYTPPEPLPKKVSFASHSTIFLSNLKSSVFPVSPSMSKLEHLLKSPSRSPNPRRSPSSFLSPSLNYHRSKNISGSGLSSSSSHNVVIPEKVNESETDDEIDIESVDPEPVLQYDASKGRNLMKECEKYVNFLRQTEVPEDWENHIVKTGWSEAQLDIFNGVIDALHNERLSRLVNDKRVGEPVLRRLSIDSTAERVRRVIARHHWNSRLTQWLHCVLVDHLDFDYLSAYLDVLQTLRAKIPDLIDKMVIISTGAASEPLPVNPLVYNPEIESSDPNSPNLNSIKETLQKNINAEAVNLVLKRKWDPFNSTIQQSRTKKLPNSPIFVMLALNPRKNHHTTHRRTKNFTSLLAGRGKVVSVSLSLNDNTPRLKLHIKKLFRVASEKVRDLKRQFPERPLFLVGWTSGAFLASRIAMVEPVAGVIALGFRLRSPYRGRGTWIRLLEMKCPILFLIGELSNFTNILDMEVFRRSLNCESSMVVVGSANDRLYIQNDIRKQILVTQSYVDKIIIDEISNFASTCKIPKPCPEEKSAKGKKKTKTVKFQTPVSNVSNVTPPGTPSTDAHIIADVKTEEKAAEPNTLSNFIDYDMVDIDNFDFDGPKMIPSNTSSSKRKAYYRPAPAITKPVDKPSPTAAVSCITASQLVQQNPGVKRFSKPSGPNVPKPKPQISVPPQTPPANSAFISNDQCFQMHLQSPTASNSVTVKQEPISSSALSKPMVFNLLATSSGQTLNINRDTGEQIPEGPAVPTRFVLLDDNNSGSVVVESGMQPFLSRPMLPMPEIRTSSGNSTKRRVSAETKGVKPATKQARQKSLSSAPSAIITAPTVLPGGATATPFIRTTMPPSVTQPSQQPFSPNSTSHLYRLLRPPFESPAISNSSISTYMAKPPVTELPMPTRVPEDLTVTVPTAVAPLIKLPQLTHQQMSSAALVVNTLPDKEFTKIPSKDETVLNKKSPEEKEKLKNESLNDETVVVKKAVEEEKSNVKSSNEESVVIKKIVEKQKPTEIEVSNEKCVAEPKYLRKSCEKEKSTMTPANDEKTLKNSPEKEKTVRAPSNEERLLRKSSETEKPKELTPATDSKVIKKPSDKDKPGKSSTSSVTQDRPEKKPVGRPPGKRPSTKVAEQTVSEVNQVVSEEKEKSKTESSKDEESVEVKKATGEEKSIIGPSNEESVINVKSLRKSAEKEKSTKIPANEEKTLKNSSEKEKTVKTPSKEEKSLRKSSEKEKPKEMAPKTDSKVIKKPSDKDKQGKPSTSSTTEEKPEKRPVGRPPLKRPYTKASDETVSEINAMSLRKSSEKEKSAKAPANDEKTLKKSSEKEKTVKTPSKEEKSLRKSSEKEKPKELAPKTDSKVIKKPSDKDKLGKPSSSSTAEEKPEKKPVGRTLLKRSSTKASEETVSEVNQEESDEPPRRLTRSFSTPFPAIETKTPSKPKQEQQSNSNNSGVKTPSQQPPSVKSQSSSKSSAADKEKTVMPSRKRLSSANIDTLMAESAPALRTRNKSGSGSGAGTSTSSSLNSSSTIVRKKTRMQDVDDSSSASSIEVLTVVKNKKATSRRGVVPKKPQKKLETSSTLSSTDNVDDDDENDEDNDDENEEDNDDENEEDNDEDNDDENDDDEEDSTSDEEEDDNGSSEENTKEDEESPPPRVTRSMVGRQSVSDDSDSGENKNSDGEHEKEKRAPSAVNRNEIVLTSGVGENSPDISDEAVADEGKSSKSQKRELRTSGNQLEGNNSSENEDTAEDEDESENRKRIKHIHPVTPASLSVTRTRKISIPNYFAYGM